MTRIELASLVSLAALTPLNSLDLAAAADPGDGGGTTIAPGDGALLGEASTIEAGQDLGDNSDGAGIPLATYTSPSSTSDSPPPCAGELVQPCIPVFECVSSDVSQTGYILEGYFGIEGPWGPCTPAEDAGAGEPARITPGRVLQAFRRIPLPAATLDIQPPGGKTLVNLDTIFSTTAGDLDKTVTLLGRRVQLRITPASYTWHHGDGTTQTSDWPGRPWEEDLDMSTYLTHAYTDAHVTVRPSVDVTYSADYRVGNGPWQPVDGTVTIEGPQASLRIVEARPVLTGAGRP